MNITGRKLFLKALQEEGVEVVFGYPGGYVIDLFDELYKPESYEWGKIDNKDEIKVIVDKYFMCLFVFKNIGNTTNSHRFVHVSVSHPFRKLILGISDPPMSVTFASLHF